MHLIWDSNYRHASMRFQKMSKQLRDVRVSIWSLMFDNRFFLFSTKFKQQISSSKIDRWSCKISTRTWETRSILRQTIQTTYWRTSSTFSTFLNWLENEENVFVFFFKKENASRMPVHGAWNSGFDGENDVCFFLFFLFDRNLFFIHRNSANNNVNYFWEVMHRLFVLVKYFEIVDKLHMKLNN